MSLIFPIDLFYNKTSKSTVISSNQNNYNVRRYDIGWVSSYHMVYDFYTYKKYANLPIEKLIDESVLSTERLNGNYDSLDICINNNATKLTIKFTNGEVFTKEIIK